MYTGLNISLSTNYSVALVKYWSGMGLLWSTKKFLSECRTERHWIVAQWGQTPHFITEPNANIRTLQEYSVGTSQPVSGIKRAHWIGCFLRFNHNLNPALEWFHFIVFFFLSNSIFFFFQLNLIAGIQKNLDVCLQWEREIAMVLSLLRLKSCRLNIFDLSLGTYWHDWNVFCYYIKPLIGWKASGCMLWQNRLSYKITQLARCWVISCKCKESCMDIEHSIANTGCIKRSLSTRVNPGLCVKAEIVQCNLAWLSRRLKPFMLTCSWYILGSTAACGFQMS